MRTACEIEKSCENCSKVRFKGINEVSHCYGVCHLNNSVHKASEYCCENWRLRSKKSLENDKIKKRHLEEIVVKINIVAHSRKKY